MKMWRNWSPHTWLVGRQHGVCGCIGIQFLEKLSIEFLSDPDILLLGMYLREKCIAT
jgi:hypothetical protein